LARYTSDTRFLGGKTGASLVVKAECVHQDGKELSQLRLGSVRESATPANAHAGPVPEAPQSPATLTLHKPRQHDGDDCNHQKCAECIHGVVKVTALVIFWDECLQTTRRPGHVNLYKAGRMRCIVRAH